MTSLLLGGSDGLINRAGSYSIMKVYCYFQASQVALVVKNPPANRVDIKRCGFDAWVRKIP